MTQTTLATAEFAAALTHDARVLLNEAAMRSDSALIAAVREIFAGELRLSIGDGEYILRAESGRYFNEPFEMFSPRTRIKYMRACDRLDVTATIRRLASEHEEQEATLASEPVSLVWTQGTVASDDLDTLARQLNSDFVAALTLPVVQALESARDASINGIAHVIFDLFDGEIWLTGNRDHAILTIEAGAFGNESALTVGFPAPTASGIVSALFAIVLRSVTLLAR